MTKRLLLALLVLSAAVAAAQCTHKPDVLWLGPAPANNATIYVGQQAAGGHPPSPLANIYSDAACTNLITQPIHTDAWGNFDFYAPCGQYLLDYSYGGSYRQIANYPVACTSADGADLGSPPPIGTGTPNTVKATDLTAKTVNKVIDPTNPAYSGSDLGAKINSALATVTSSATILIPPALNSTPLPLSTGVVIAKDGITLKCADQGTVLNWTPSNGTAVSVCGTQRVKLDGCTLKTSTASSTAVCVKIGCDTGYTANTEVDGWSCGVEDGNKHFAKAFWVTGDDDANPSGNTRITKSHARGYTTCGFCFDHTIDPYLDLSDAYAPAPNTTNAQGILEDTGASGLHVSMTSVGNAGTTIQNTMPTTGPYGKPPNYSQFTNSALCDTSPRDGLVLAASLDTLSGPDSRFRGDTFVFTNIWCGGAGLGYSNSSPRRNVVINGGTQLHFDDMITRVADCDGWKINGGDHIYIRGGNSRANNQGNYADGDANCPHAAGVHVGANVNDVLIDDTDLRGTNSYESGHQKYGLYVDSGTGDYVRAFHVDARNENTGDVVSNATGTHNRFDYVASDGSDVQFRTRVRFFTDDFYLDPNSGSPLLNWGPNSYQYYSAGQLTSSFGGTQNLYQKQGVVGVSTGTSLDVADKGSCTMASGTCSAQSLTKTYATAPKCYVTWTGTGTLTGVVKVASTTTTVTPSSSVGSDTAVVNWVCFGG